MKHEFLIVGKNELKEKLKESTTISLEHWKWNAETVTLGQHHKLHNNTEQSRFQDQLSKTSVLSEEGWYRFNIPRHQQLQKSNTWSTTNKTMNAWKFRLLSKIGKVLKNLPVSGICCIEKRAVYVFSLRHHFAPNVSFIQLYIVNCKTNGFMNFCTVVGYFSLESKR